MTIANAKRFVSMIQTDDEFRQDIYKLSGDILIEVLKEWDLFFSYEEFEEALRIFRLNAANAEEDMAIQELEAWYCFLYAPGKT